MNNQKYEIESRQQKKEKKSPTKRVDLTEFYKRNENLNLKKKQMYQSGEQKKFEEEIQNRNYLKKLRYYHPSPITAPKKSNDLWDEDGNLIQENLQSSRANANKSSDFNKQTERKNNASNREDFNEFLKRNQPKNKQEPQKVVPQYKTDFSSFIKRQDESFKNKTKEYPLPKQKSYMLKKSSELAMKASTKAQNKNEPSEIEYSFHPDMSKTINYQVNRLPIELAETHLVLKNYEIENLKLEIDAEKKKQNESTNNSPKKQTGKSNKKTETCPKSDNFDKGNQNSSLGKKT